MTPLPGATSRCESTASNRDGECDDDQDCRDRERDPHTGGNGLGRRRRDVDRARCECEHGSHDGCPGDEPEIARQVEHAGNDPALVWADIHHDGGVVGRLEQRIAGGDEARRGHTLAHEVRAHGERAVSAGREIRVIVTPEAVDDLSAIKMARDLATKIEATLKYPGTIKVNIIRETRAIEFAK